MKNTLIDRLSRRMAYTMIEVLAAGAVVAIGTTAAVSLSASLIIQEEFTWRVAVVRNYEENMARLWQLGLSAATVQNILPTRANNPLLAQQIFGTPTIQELGITGLDADASKTQVHVHVEVANVTASVNIGTDPNPVGGTQVQGAPQTLKVCRPIIR
ncbi:MAG: hypothetical protein KDK97_13165 [Verrucomicrobiales bacterium]|nr:hypothetical protein [Verrucomicrobiales bacterium]